MLLGCVELNVPEAWHLGDPAKQRIVTLKLDWYGIILHRCDLMECHNAVMLAEKLLCKAMPS